MKNTIAFYTKNLALFVLVFTGSTVLAVAQSNGKIVEQITKLEAKYDAAYGKQSAEDYDRLHTADFMNTVFIPPRIVAKADIMTRMKDPNRKRWTIESLTSDDVKVRVYGDSTAIVTGSWKRVSRDANGKDTSAAGRFTRVWVRQDGTWQVAAAHYSPSIDLEKSKAAQSEIRKN